MNHVAIGCLLAGGAFMMSVGSAPAVAADMPAKTAKATLAGGCFWCTEAVFAELKGVKKVVSGYTNGTVPNPNYKQVCTGLTGHAEAIEIEYDPALVSFEKLLEVFFATHDPTTLNQQGADRGTQYRSGIYYHDDAQKQAAEKVIKALDDAKAFSAKIVTEVKKAEKFYPAEDYHQDYFANNPNQPYCRAVAAPKVDKVRKVFKDLVK